jgi:hypothetical protein
MELKGKLRSKSWNMLVDGLHSWEIGKEIKVREDKVDVKIHYVLPALPA